MQYAGMKLAKDRTVCSLLLAMVCVIALSAWLTASASAEITLDTSTGSGGAIGSSGEGAGNLNRPTSLDFNESTGDFYVLDSKNNRVEQFTETGQFVRTWGYDVVATGQDNKQPDSEVQVITIEGDSGTFRLSFEGETTAALPFDATTGEVEAALNALQAIEEEEGGEKGSVSVSEGSGGPSTYQVTFDGGPLKGTNQPQIELTEAFLGMPAGTQLTCTGRGESFAAQPKSTEYQWLANGQPIAGATTPNYTPTAADAGKAIQCEFAATWFKVRAMRTDRTFHIPSPVSGIAPEGPAQAIRPEASGSLQVGGSGGTILTCNAGTWTHSPTSYTYQWYRNGQPLGGPTSTTQTSDTYEVQEADLAERGAFQCSVTGANASGASIIFSELIQTSPGSEPQPGTPTVQVAASVASRTSTRTEGGAAFEICEASHPTDVCKAGLVGSALGQFNFEANNFQGPPPAGIAVDNSPLGQGDVYVLDPGNFRVEKFSATGEPLLEFGGEVNKSTGANLCVAGTVDACGAGIQGNMLFGLPSTYAPAFFGGWHGSEQYTENGDDLAVDENGDVYVGDQQDVFPDGKPRIQKFDSGGNFLSQVQIPEKGTSPGFFSQPVSVEVNAAGESFAAVSADNSAVDKFQPSQYSVEPTGPSFSERFAFNKETRPVQLAVDPTTHLIWVSDRNFRTSRLTQGFHICGEKGFFAVSALLAYDTEGHRYECAVPENAKAIGEVTGLAISPSGKAYIANGNANRVRVYTLPHPQAPKVESGSVSGITAESATLGGKINPGFAATEYSFEYGLEDCATSSCLKTPTEVAYGDFSVPIKSTVVGLQPDTQYHYRIVLHNAFGDAEAADGTFATYAAVNTLNDPCANALARKQTKAAELYDCRAYELASAESTAGYDVESDLVPGEQPFALVGQTAGKVLYGVHDGGIPGTGNPTNRGIDPYVAVRNATAKRWETHYVGIPADAGFSTDPFSSTLAEADRQLGSFVFAGDEICAPCFGDGSTGLPVHLADGTLVQGMKGSIPHTDAEPAGYVGRYLSDDGTHLVFGTTSKLEPAGNSGEVSIYERNLVADTTDVVSTLPDGSTMEGVEVGELDMSGDGSRVVVGEEVSTDGAGNTYWHPYMHLAGSAESADLAPGTTTGVLFDGMTADGSKVFYTTKDKLLAADTDESADLYEAEVGPTGAVTLRLISVAAGGSSNSDACGPNGWNAASGDGKCGALAIGGGAGVAAGNGTVYFLSPELLDGANGTADQPNLYFERQGGSPQFVATLEPSNPLVIDAAQDSAVRHWADFDVSPSGDFAAFATTRPLVATYQNNGFSEVYRYDAGSGKLDCLSCNPTEAPASSNASLPQDGLGLTEDGRVFFNTREALVLHDSNQNLDGYEWENGTPRLVSTGTSTFDSGMLGVTADGTDAFFFTREKLVESDFNGEAMKLYDARADGGFFEIPEAPPCAASDECHGPSTQAPPPPQLGTFKGTGGQHQATGPKSKCKKGFVKKHGKCVRRKHRRSHHHRGTRTAKKTGRAHR